MDVRTTSLLVEGWRGISHSYAMVNQYQLLALRASGVRLFHRDLPFYRAGWNAQSSPSGFDPARAAAIAAVPPPPAGFRADATYRIAYPLSFTRAAHERLFVHGTSESHTVARDVPAAVLAQGRSDAGVAIVTPSHWSKAGFVRAGFDEARVHVIAHGVDPAIFAPISAGARAATRAVLGLAAEHFALLSLGSMTRYKGIDLLIIAYAMLRRTYPHLRLVLKDSRSLYGLSGAAVLDELRAGRPDLITPELASSIIFLSQDMSLADLRALYGAVDCYASSYRAEGFNLPPLEAAACGTPIVVTKGGATDDYCHPSFALQVEGLRLNLGGDTIIEPDVESLVAQLALLLEGRAAAINPEAAVAHIHAKLSWDAAVEKLMVLLQS